MQTCAENKKVSLAEIQPVISEILDSGGRFRVTVTGTSMLPTLREGRDQVEFAKPDRPCRKYDLPLYRRDSGQFVMHRVLSVDRAGRMTCCGDHQWVREPGLRQDQVVALVVRICRKGREFSVDSLRYRLWVRFWVLSFPCRRFLVRTYHWLDRHRPERKHRKEAS